MVVTKRSKEEWDFFSDNLVALRASSSMSCNALSRKIFGNVFEGYILKYEKGQARPTRSNLQRIAATFCISVDNLFQENFGQRVLQKSLKNNEQG